MFASLLAAVGIPLSLLWDFSWESTVGIDRVWTAPHAMNYAAIALAGTSALALIAGTTRRARAVGVRLGKWQAPLGAWIALWGTFVFLAAFLFDRWWQAGYGLVAGIWHPPQLLKAVAFFAVTIGVWILAAVRGGALVFAAAGAVVLTMIGVVSLASNFANRQHSAPFFQIACGTYPIVLVALGVAGRGRFPATLAALVYTVLWGAMVWLLPLLPGEPLVAPIYHPRDHLLPPPFPLLLVLPALAIDALLRVFPGRSQSPAGWGAAAEGGLAFGIVLLVTQWSFAQFLLSPAADNRFFAGGGRHWPFFLAINPEAQTSFWITPRDSMNLPRSLTALALAVLAARIGLWIGAWMKNLRR